MGTLSGRIVVMSEELSSKIAAGEVVERPSSIVKELVENSIDAGATDITIELEGGGKKSIHVIDNGEGMGREDALLAFERHATSKIYSFEDIYQIETLGFRGEAIPSIASVSRLEMITRRKDAETGTRITAEGGVICDIVDAGCPVGTAIHISNIFKSMPARRKFLKKDATEQVHCVDTVVRLALAHPDVKMQVLSNRRQLLRLSKGEDVSERIATIFGDQLSNNILAVHNTEDTIQVRGYISNPTFTRSNTKGIFCFVNGRFVRDSLIHNAVMASYRRVMEPRRYPSAVLFIDLPPHEVDVNVHPTKVEVRFADSRSVYGAIVAGIAATLAGQLPFGNVPAEESADQVSSRANAYRRTVQESLKRYTVFAGDRKPSFTSKGTETLESTAPREVSRLFDVGTPTPGRVTFAILEYIAQIGATYLLFSSGDGLVIIDQHAAHERVLFEKMRSPLRRQSDEKQVLLLPEIVTLSPREYSLFVEFKETLQEAGFEIDEYGVNTIAIRSHPSFLVDIDLKTIISDTVEEIVKTGVSLRLDDAREKILTFLACRGAIKANHRLDRDEVQVLMRELDSVPYASTCPHGRPLYVKFDMRDLERMFKRR